jgi:hypothetical protein
VEDVEPEHSLHGRQWPHVDLLNGSPSPCAHFVNTALGFNELVKSVQLRALIVKAVRNVVRM